jgi:hypothetical protein
MLDKTSSLPSAKADRALVAHFGCLVCLLVPALSVAEQRICICAVPDIPQCRAACDAPPREQFKTITVSAGPGITPLASTGYEYRFPSLPSSGATAEAVRKALENPQIRAQVKTEFDSRAESAAAVGRALDDPDKASGLPASSRKSLAEGFKTDAKRFEDWSAAIGAAEARAKLKSDLEPGAAKK